MFAEVYVNHHKKYNFLKHCEMVYCNNHHYIKRGFDFNVSVGKHNKN
jgi:hypothetical protein